MATAGILLARSVLVSIEVPLEAGELPQRLFWGRPSFKRWLEDALPGEPADRGGRLSPLEQVDDLLYRFITGERLQDVWDLRLLNPQTSCVWELKTIDVRIFGWFPIKDAFLAVNGSMKWKLRDIGYRGYVNEVRMFRDRLDLNEPKYLHGSEVRDVISF